MSTKYNASLFESLQEIINNKSANYDSGFKDFLKLETDKTYVVRLIPNVEDISKTWYHYSQHIWESIVTGKKVSTLCPNTYKEKCPICEYRSKIWATKNQDLIDGINPTRKNKRWLYNVFVIKDPTNPENEGKIKLLNAGEQLEKVIEEARSGEFKDEFGYKIFDLSSNGCNLNIKVEKNKGGYPTYVSSRFTSPSKIDALSTDAAIDEVHSNIKALDTIFKVRTYNEVKDLLDIHFLGKDKSTVTDDSIDDVKVESNDEDDDFDVTTSTTSTLSDQEKRMKEILEDL
jgi:gp32 DNA binding protein like